MRLSTPLADLTERELSRLIYEAAELMGWKRFHTWRSVKSPPGFPDETLCRDRVIFLELKTEVGRVSPAQLDWLAALRIAQAEVYLVRPRNFEALVQVLRWRCGSRPTEDYMAARGELLRELDAVLGEVKAA